nr:hypothetical protein [Tanacetum cinerariifolium]
MFSSDSAVTYTSISSEDVPFWGIRFFGMEQPDSPEAAQQSPIQTPPVLQDEDECEPIFIQPHDPNYSLPPVVSPTAESPGYVIESDPEEYEDDELENCLVDYHIDGDNRRNVQTARPYFYAYFMKCQPLNFKGTKGVVGLTRWIKKMESVFQIS